VDEEPRGPGRADDLAEALEGPHRAAAPVVRVLQRHQPRVGVVIVVGRPHRGEHLLGGQHPAVALERARLDAPQRRHPAALEVEAVAPRLADHLVALAALEADGDLVGLRARGDEQPGGLAEELRRALLEAAHGGVLAVDVVAHLGLRHGPAHLRAGAGDGVRAKVDLAHGGVL